MKCGIVLRPYAAFNSDSGEFTFISGFHTHQEVAVIVWPVHCMRNRIAHYAHFSQAG